MARSVLGLLLFLLLLPVNISADPVAEEDLPAPLKSWVQWVLHGDEDRKCPFLYKDFKSKYCSWPGRLNLALNEQGGQFSIRWRVYAQSRVELPGDLSFWPQNINVNDQPAVVLKNENKPVLWLGPGDYKVTGNFSWSEPPKQLVIPNEIGMLRLTWDGKIVEFPDVDQKGRLWLSQDQGGKSARNTTQNSTSVKVFRRIIDDIPLLMETRIELDIAGDQREILLEKFHSGGFIPLSIKSSIPARLEADGSLRTQVRPGKWVINITLRNPAQVTELILPSIAKPWPDQEIWVFDARRYQRLVEIEGVPDLDPAQTNLPQRWKSLPAYLMRDGDTMTLKVIRRGDPHPEPNKLSLEKTLWLDFDGRGYTVKDVIQGTMTEGWRLNVGPDMKLGQVMVDGKPQLITLEPDSKQQGVEVRKGRINLVADSRINTKPNRLPVSGWLEEFHKVNATLKLPPGWKLLFVDGVDNKADTWINRWTLLDLFLVLIVSLGVGKLWGKKWMLLSLVTLTLIWHEPSAPRYVWMNILAAVALLRVVPVGKLSRAIKFYRHVSVFVLVVIGIPFMVGQVRVALYPQLEWPWMQTYPQQISQPSLIPGDARIESSVMSRSEVKSIKPGKAREKFSRSANRRTHLNVTDQIDLNAKVQTGPGLPQWRWREVSLKWNGPVEQGQTIGAVLLPPSVNKLLNIVGVVLFSFLALFIVSGGGGFSLRRILKSSGAAAILLPLFSVIGIDTARADIPNQVVLTELREKLLLPPDCLPVCAQIQLLKLKISPSSISMEAEIHAREALAVPIPVPSDSWFPGQAIINQDQPIQLFRGEKQGLWLKVKKGISRFEYSGRLPQADRIDIPLPLIPHRVEVESEGWLVDGIYKNARPDSQLQLSRINAGDKGTESVQLQERRLPPFFRLERTFLLGLDWRIATRIIRLSNLIDPIIAKVPVLDGEAVTTRDIRVENGMIAVNLAPGQKIMEWNSVYNKQTSIQLKSGNTTAWTELWRVNASPVWHLDFSGIPVVYHQQNPGVWAPEWRPWPGEAVTINISRPEPIAGQILTIDDSRLQIKPGERSTDTQLEFTLRSSQGGQHTIVIPSESKLLSIAIDGQNQPTGLKENQLTLPVRPGKQTYSINWREPSQSGPLFRSQSVNLNTESVNNRINLTLGRDRWVLMTGGPLFGPAVLFWGMVVVIMIIAFGLGWFLSTPLGYLSWFLLLIGLSQVSVQASFIVVGWLIALSLRKNLNIQLSKFRYNLMQVGLILLTLGSLVIFLDAVNQGLLGLPAMQVAGNGSTAYNLNWYSDHSGIILPSAWVLSAPLWIYHLLMLFWALWLALSLLKWLQWGWECFSKQGVWRSIEWKNKGDTVEAKNKLPP